MPVIGSRGTASIKALGFGGAGLPLAPTLVVATNSDGVVNIGFTPGYNGGATVTSYTAIATPDGARFTGSSSPIVATGLDIGTPYTFVVYATNVYGDSPYSTSSGSLTYATVPLTTTVGTATILSPTSVSVPFTAPLSDGGSTITSYTAVSNPGGITGTVNQSGSGSIVISGLTPGVEYTFTVYATNSVGNGTQSVVSNSVQPDLPTYTITSNLIPVGAESVNEGSIATFYIDTNATVTTPILYWSATGTGITVGDFASGATTGSISITPTIRSTVSLSVVSDNTTEGTETFTLRFFTNAARTIELTGALVEGYVIGNGTVVSINDTSTTSYTITPNVSAVNEGSSVTFSLTSSSNVTETLYWSVQQMSGTVNSSDLTQAGSVLVSSGSGSFGLAVTADQITEGAESFRILLYLDSSRTTLVKTSSTVTINDTSTTVYSVVPAASSVDEGSTLTFNVSGTKIVDGTYYWTVSRPADFSTSSGSFTIASNAGSFSVTPTADVTAEGAETFTASVRIGSVSGTVVGTSSAVTINDTSKPTYAVAASGGATSVNEGSSLTFNVSTTDVADSTTLYWTILDSATGGTTAASDFLSTSGSFTIIGNGGTFAVSPTADALTEGAESFKVQVRTVSTSGIVVATSSLIIVTDTSKTVSYAVAASGGATSVNEGSSLTFNVATTGVADNTTLYWSVSASGDFSTSSGSFVITSGAGSFSVSPREDATTEGAESFTASVRIGGVSGTIVATSSSVTINDTSLASTYAFGTIPASINEGGSGTFIVNTTNVANGTVLYWTISRTADFSTSSGTVTISSNTGSFSVSPTADATTEGAETFTASVRIGGTGGTIVATSSSVTINDTSGNNEILSGGTNPFTVGSSLSYSVSGGIPNTTLTYSWTGVNPSNGAITVVSSASVTLNSSGSAAIPSVVLSTPGTYTINVTFNGSGNTRSVTAKSYINASFSDSGVYELQFSTVATTAQRGLRLSNLTGYGGLSYALQSPYTGTTAGNPASGTLVLGNNALILLANPHSGGTASMMLAQTNQATTTLTTSVPSQIQYSWTNFQTEYALSPTQLTLARNTILPYFTTNNTYATSMGTRYGLFRNPDSAGIAYWAKVSPTFNINNFFGGMSGDDGTRSKTRQTIYKTGTGYPIFLDKGAP